MDQRPQGRTLLTGYPGQLDYRGHAADMPREMADLSGMTGPFERTTLAGPSTRSEVREEEIQKSTHTLNFARPLGAIRQGDTITYRDQAGSVAHLEKPSHGEVLATFDGPDGPAVLVRNNLPNGNRIYTAGFELGPAMDGPWSTPPQLDAMTPIYEALAEELGLRSPIGRDIPRNLGVHISRDGSVLLFKDIFDRPTEGVLALPLASLPPAARVHPRGSLRRRRRIGSPRRGACPRRSRRSTPIHIARRSLTRRIGSNFQVVLGVFNHASAPPAHSRGRVSSSAGHQAPECWWAWRTMYPLWPR